MHQIIFQIILFPFFFGDDAHVPSPFLPNPGQTNKNNFSFSSADLSRIIFFFFPTNWLFLADGSTPPLFPQHRQSLRPRSPLCIGEERVFSSLRESIIVNSAHATFFPPLSFLLLSCVFLSVLSPLLEEKVQERSPFLSLLVLKPPLRFPPSPVKPKNFLLPTGEVDFPLGFDPSLLLPFFHQKSKLCCRAPILLFRGRTDPSFRGVLILFFVVALPPNFSSSVPQIAREPCSFSMSASLLFPPSYWH